MKLKIKCNIYKVKNHKTSKIDRRFNNIFIDFDWTYFKKIIFEIKNPVQFFNKHLKKTERMHTELLKGSHRKKNKITHKYIYLFLFFSFTYIKIEIMSKIKLRKIFKRMGVLNGAKKS